MQYGITDILELLGALGLFLFGMKFMSDALLDLAGDRMRRFLAGMTSNRLKGISTGFLITAVIQSSSATTLMVVSFANASLLSLTESIGVIMGANIGTTVTAWLITVLGFKVSMAAIALPLVGLGLGLTFLKKKSWQHLGHFIIGFALLFIGLEFLKEAMPNIDQNPQILSFLQEYTGMGFGSVLLFLLLGTLLTVVLQSSSATMALTLLMTAQGWIPYELAAAMILGENIGTTITANLAALMGNYKARQTARAHLLFNIFGVIWMLLVFYPFLRGVAWGVESLGGASPYLVAASIPVAISLFHTSFNIVNTFLMVWLVRPMAWLVKRWVPERIPEEKAIEAPKFLSEEALAYPETAIAALEQETRYLYEQAVFEIVAHAMNLHREAIFSDEKSKKVVQKAREDLQTNVRELYLVKVKRIYSKIIEFAVRAQSGLELTKQQHSRIAQIKWANRKMVEIIREAGEVNRNVSKYMDGSNKAMKAEYDFFRKKIVKVLRTLRGFHTEVDSEKYLTKLQELSVTSSAEIREGNLEIDGLIRKGLISPEMASSLFNDHDNVNDMIQNLIDVTVLLYGRSNPLMDATEAKAAS